MGTFPPLSPTVTLSACQPRIGGRARSRRGRLRPPAP